jgi:molecular chaperone GrpE
MDDTLINDSNANNDSNESTTSTPQNQIDDQVVELKNKITELEDKYRRLLAEKVNSERQQEQLKAYMNSKLLEQLIDISDDLEVILNQIPEAEKGSVGEMGSSMAHGKLSILLMSNGVFKIETKEGDDFNSIIHEAIGVEQVENMKNKVVKILRNGYKLQDRILRPVRVIVGS